MYFSPPLGGAVYLCHGCYVKDQQLLFSWCTSMSVAIETVMGEHLQTGSGIFIFIYSVISWLLLAMKHVKAAVSRRCGCRGGGGGG